MPYNPQQPRPFNFNIDQNGLIELAKVADPMLVMQFLDQQAPGGSPANTPPYAEQQPPAWSVPSPEAAAVFGNSAAAPPTPLPQEVPLQPAGGVGLGPQALSLLSQMNRPQQRLAAPTPGFAPRPAQIQFQQFLPQATNTRRPDLASIIYGRR